VGRLNRDTECNNGGANSISQEVEPKLRLQLVNVK